MRSLSRTLAAFASGILLWVTACVLLGAAGAAPVPVTDVLAAGTSAGSQPDEQLQEQEQQWQQQQQQLQLQQQQERQQLQLQQLKQWQQLVQQQSQQQSQLQAQQQHEQASHADQPQAQQQVLQAQQQQQRQQLDQEQARQRQELQLQQQQQQQQLQQRQQRQWQDLQRQDPSPGSSVVSDQPAPATAQVPGSPGGSATVAQPPVGSPVKPTVSGRATAHLPTPRARPEQAGAPGILLTAKATGPDTPVDVPAEDGGIAGFLATTPLPGWNVGRAGLLWPVQVTMVIGCCAIGLATALGSASYVGARLRRRLLGRW
jgi:hypothetical protein